MKRDIPDISFEYEVKASLMMPTSRQKAEGTKYVVRFAFSTVREFSTFRYELNVEMKSGTPSTKNNDAKAESVIFNIGGISIPSLQLPVGGTAAKEYNVELPSDSLSVELHRKDGRQAYHVTIQKNTLRITPLGEESFARMIAEG